MKSEASILKEVLIAESKLGNRLWRNNVGAATDPHTGRPIRYGLCNDSHQMNRVFKSGDLIGVTPVVITQDMVGQTLGVFTSIECKREGWRFTGNGREQAQMNWIEMIQKLGGFAKFSDGGEY